MTVTIDSADPRAAKALALLAGAHTWTHGRRKCDGLPFAIVPGSKAGSTYMVSEPMVAVATPAASASCCCVSIRSARR